MRLSLRHKSTTEFRTNKQCLTHISNILQARSRTSNKLTWKGLHNRKNLIRSPTEGPQKKREKEKEKET